jgi:DNA-binding NarL/FixJ family response regulator
MRYGGNSALNFGRPCSALGHRGNGESFTASVWFSTYKEGMTHKLAAIIADVSDEEAAGGGSAAVPSDSSASVPEQRERTPLGDREAGVLRLVVQGLANKEIAARMAISASAVKNTMQQLFGKTGVRTRSQLVRVALEQYRNIL